MYAGFCSSGPCRGAALDLGCVVPRTLQGWCLSLCFLDPTGWCPWHWLCGPLQSDALGIGCVDHYRVMPLTLFLWSPGPLHGDRWYPWPCPWSPGPHRDDTINFDYVVPSTSAGVILLVLSQWSLDSHSSAALPLDCMVPWLPQGCCFGLFMWSLDSHRGAVLDCLCGLLTPPGVLHCLCGPLTPTGVLFWTLFLWSPSVITYMVDCQQAALLSSHSISAGSPQGTVYKWLHRHWHNTSHKILWWFCNRRSLQLRFLLFC